MKHMIARFRSQTIMALGIDRLEDRFLRFFAMRFSFSVFTNIHGAFVATLLIRATGDSKSVMLYNVINYFGTGFFMLVAVAFLRKTTPRLSLQLGILFFILMYAVFLSTMGMLQYSMFLIALLSGLASGFYWISDSMALTAYSSDHNRDTAMGLLSLGGGFISLTVPFLSGLVISRFHGSTTGYRVMFSVAMVIALFTIYLSTRTEPFFADSPKTDYRSAAKLCFTDRLFLNLCLCDTVKGIREGTIGFFLNILLFQIITDEMIVGVNTLLASVGSILAATFYGKLVRTQTRLRSVRISVMVLLAAALVLLLELSPATILMFSVINSFFSPYLVNPAFSIFVAGIYSSPKALPLKGEILAIRECFLNTGRILGIGITLLMPSTTFGSVLAIIVLTLFQFIMYAQLRYSSKLMERQAQEALPQS